jgi:hypothetical protein
MSVPLPVTLHGTAKLRKMREAVDAKLPLGFTSPIYPTSISSTLLFPTIGSSSSMSSIPLLPELTIIPTEYMPISSRYSELRAILDQLFPYFFGHGLCNYHLYFTLISPPLIFSSHIDPRPPSRGSFVVSWDISQIFVLPPCFRVLKEL